MNRGVVTPCPKGTFRVGTALATAQLNCTRCDRGWTTAGVAATLPAQCNRTRPGFKGGADQTSSAAAACDVGSWSGERPGGDNSGLCITCGNGWTTQNNTVDTDGLPIGSTSQSACGKS
jgi:hypothetical protein